MRRFTMTQRAYVSPYVTIQVKGIREGFYVLCGRAIMFRGGGEGGGGGGGGGGVNG